MRLLREWVRIILEGYKEDQETLIKKFPDSQNEIVRMNPKMINWFIRRFGNTPSVKETHPFEDCIPTIQKYEKKAAGLGQKYGTNEYFRSLVDRRFPKKNWSNLADYTNMTVDQMEEIMGLSERKKPRFEIEGNEPDRSDYLGKFGPWNLWMPSNRENSVKIAGYDPETLVPKTTWCTARMTGSNLFYNYTGKGVILFYIIKDNPQTDTDWLSVGFINGKLISTGDDGGVTVDRINKGLTEEKLRSALSGYYDRLMSRMQEKTDEIGGEHPARKKIEEAAQSLPAYQNLIKGLGKEEREDLKLAIIQQQNISPEILDVLANDESDTVRKRIASNPNTPSHILDKLANDQNERIREYVSENPNTSNSTLEKFSNDKSFYIRSRVAHNPNTPAHILEKLANDPYECVRSSVAHHHNTPVHILELLSKNNSKDIRRSIASNHNTPVHILEKLSNDINPFVKLQVAYHSKTPIYILEKFASDKSATVRYGVASNKNTPLHILEKLSSDVDKRVRWQIPKNPTTSVQILEKLTDDKEVRVRWQIADIENISVQILEKLASDKSSMIREKIARNPNTPIHILEKLSRDKNKNVKQLAKQALINKKNQQQLAELRKLIYNLI